MIAAALFSVITMGASFYFTWIHNAWAAVGFFLAATLFNVLHGKLIKK